MTRYTDLGRKRTFLEAGFSNEDAAEDSTPTLVEPNENSRKRRKRTKGKGETTDAMSSNHEERVEEGGSRDGAEDGRRTKKLKKAKFTNKAKDAASRSESRRLKRIQERDANTICFACREKGHSAKHCRNVNPDGGEGRGTERGKQLVGVCYQCGSSKHTLARCRKPRDPDNPLPYASCFVCSGKGHLASSCPKNKDKGIYPNGGCCKLCNETSHLARDCPLRKQPADAVTFAGTGREVGADEDDFHAIKRKTTEVDREERAESRALKKLDVKMGAMSKTVKSFASHSPASTKKKVVFF